MTEIWITSGWDKVGILHDRDYSDTRPPGSGPYINSHSLICPYFGFHYDLLYWDKYRDNSIPITEKDIYSSREEAIEAVESLRTQKINDMRKELARLEALEIKIVEVGND